VSIAAEVRGFELDVSIARAVTSEEIKERARRLGRRASLPVQTAIGAALEAWSHARLETYAADRVGLVIGGSNLSQGESSKAHARHLKSPDFVNPKFAVEFMDTNYLGVLSEVFGTTGEGFTVGGASASGNVALIKASDMILSGRCDACVVVGPMADLSDVELQAFHNSGALAKKYAAQPAKACRPFDREHDGFVYGQASACIVLEASEAASSRNAPVLARLLGGAIHLDGNASTNPNVLGEVAAMRDALARAGMEPDEVDYVNAHGSSSPLGDDTEVSALKELFGSQVAKLVINSTKGLTGHCLWSAGLVEAIATVAQMRGGFIHANANLENPVDSDCRFAGPKTSRASVRRAMSNSFGFGGINSSIVLAGASQ
jgi:malonyl-ACP decarboxylase